MSLENLQRSFDQRSSSLSAFDQFMTDGDPTPVGTVDGEDTSTDVSLAAAIAAGSFTVGAASYTWKSYMAMQALAPKPDAWDQIVAFGKKVNLKTALERVERGGDVVKLMEALPTVGTTIKRLPISEILKEAEKAIEALDPSKLAMESAIQRMDAAQAKAYEASKSVFAVSATITGVGLVGTGIATAYAAKSDQFLDEESDSTASYAPLVDDAFTEFEMRTDASLGDLDVTIAKVQDFADNLPDMEALVKLMVSLETIADPLFDLIAEINGLVTPYENFLTTANIIATPLDPVFSFFENPPDILPVFGTIKTCIPFTDICTEVPNPIPIRFDPIFNPIPRSQIQKIIDLINTITGIPGELFDTAFGVILGPIEDAITDFLQPLLDKLNPFDDYITDFNIASEIIAELEALVKVIKERFDDLVALLPDIDIDIELAPIKEIGVFEEGGMSMFLGQESDEKLIGIKSTLANSVMQGAILQGNGGNDDVTGTEDNDLLGGGTGNDVIEGLAGDDVIYGDEGNDIIDGGPGSDVIFGGIGYDIAQFLTEDFDEFVFTQKDGGIEITRSDGADVDFVKGIEELQFQDRTVQATDIFPDLVTDPEPTEPEDVTEAATKFTGGAADDLIASGAGRAAFIVGGGGADTFEFKTEVRNGDKEIDVVEDFELGIDIVRLTEGDVSEVRQTSGGLVLILEDDGDAIYLRGDSLQMQDLSSVYELA